MMSWQRNLSFATIVLMLILGFQNCGQVMISPLPVEVVVASQSVTQMTAQGCVNSVTMAPEKTKFIFVIDLSRSNIGEFYKGNYSYNGNMLPGYPFFNADLGTDPNGVRFDALSNFVSTCGSSSNADYAVIGFSNAAGTIVKNGAANTLQCKNQFMNSATAIAQLDLMKQTQFEETTFYKQFKEPASPYLSQHATQAAPLLYKETNYVAATDCISSTIEADLSQAANDTSNYQVFFISDGEAQSTTVGCESAADKVKCYTEKMNVKLSYLMKLSSAKSKPIRINAMYYTTSGVQNLKIESYMNYLSAIGQTDSPINLGSLQNGTSGQNPFCKLLAVDKSIVYRSNKIFAVNTNAIKIGKELKKDTDEDGLPDDEEASYSALPNNPRSMVPGVLDGICKMIGGKQLCAQARSQITCDATKINKFNMSDCDIKILKLDQTAVRPELAGIDSDNDGIPDYIEILKGLNPVNNDSYLDYDGDGLSNMQEISMGLDPFTPDATDPQIIHSSSVFREQIQSCTSGGWELNIDSVSGVPGTNHMMLFFRTESKNTQGLLEYRIYKTGYDLDQSNMQNWVTRLLKDSISVSDFELVTVVH